MTRPDGSGGWFAFLYAICLRLTPRGFRERFGEEARATAAETVRRARERGGPWAALKGGLGECVDLMCLGIRLRTARAPSGRRPAPLGSRGLGPAALVWDAGHAFRGLRRSPGFTLAVVLTLGLGIGGGTAVFTVVNNTLLRPMMIRDVDRVLRLDDVTFGPGGLGSETNVSPLDAEAIREEATAFSGVAIQDYRAFVLTGEGDAERLRGSGVSAGWDRVLGIEPAVGRVFTERESERGEDAGAVMVSWRLWQRHWAGSPAVLGRTVELNGRPRVIVGVLPRGFRFPYEADVWVPIRYDRTDGANRYLLVFGRLRPGADPEQAGRELDVISRRLASAHPETDAGWTIHAGPLRRNLVRGYDRTALALLAIVGVLLLVSCANVGGLLLARASGRRREMAVRAALGAGRSRQLAVPLLEVALLTATGGGLGLLIASWARPFLGLLVPPVMSVELAQNAIAIDARVVLFVLAASALSAALSGLGPAVRVSVRHPARALRERGGESGSWRRRGVRVLVGAEVALASVLLLGAGSVIAEFLRHESIPAGFDGDDVLTLRVTLPEVKYPTADARIRAAGSLLQEVGSVPGVARAAYATGDPQLPGWTTSVTPEGVGTGVHDGLEVNLRHVSPGLLATLGIPVREGRGTATGDTKDAPLVAVVSRRLAERLWPGDDPLGKRLRLGRPQQGEPWLTVVGVAGDVREQSDVPFTLYEPYAQHAAGRPAWELHLMVRAAGGDPSDLAPAVRRAIASVDPDLPAYGVGVLSRVQSDGYLLQRAGARLGGAFALFGLLLSAVGIFGIVAYAVGRMQRDLAVRKALGGHPTGLAFSLLGDVAGAAAGGLVIGSAAAWALRRLVGTRIPDLAAAGVRLHLVVVLVLAVVVLAAGAGPARRAARVDPMRLLRED